jgi:hypothetical protein
MCFSHFHNVLKAFISITTEKDEFKLILFSKYTEHKQYLPNMHIFPSTQGPS